MNDRRARDMNNRRIKEAFDDGSVIDEAMNHAFYAAVRLHRMHGIPLALWENGKVCYVDPYEIVLPGETPSAMGKYTHVPGTSDDFAREKQEEIAREGGEG